jgi:FPC/CPF motif-containing protein YcgG
MVRCGRLSKASLIEADGSVSESAAALYAAQLFDAMVRSEHYPCTGAKAAQAHGSLRFGHFPGNLSGETITHLRDGILSFESQRGSVTDAIYSSYIAVFPDWAPTNEERFVEELWTLLQQLHERDHASGSDWDQTASRDPNNPHFGFSIGARAYFLVALHPNSSRWARRFLWPALVFNSHYQFAELRKLGIFDSMRDRIRERDMSLQGSYNPQMVGSKVISEARQYAGNDTPPEWACPFINRNTGDIA